MYENQFISWNSVPPTECEVAMAIPFAEPVVKLFVPNGTNMFKPVALDGSDIGCAWTNTGAGGYSTFNNTWAAQVNDGQLFRLKASDYSGSVVYYSNALCRAQNEDELSCVEFKCYENAFGLPFIAAAGGMVRMLLPVLLKSPEYKQESKTYTKANGQVVTLYAKHYKEWEAETEYMPEWWHDAMACVLGCDELYIDGVRVTKSADYEVDWDQHIELEDGTKIAKATFKVQANTNERNSNF